MNKKELLREIQKVASLIGGEDMNRVVRGALIMEIAEDIQFENESDKWTFIINETFGE